MKHFLPLLRRIGIILLLVWLLSCTILVALIYYTGTIDEAAPADVIIVLGAGLTPDGRPNWALSRRSEHAAELWKAGYAPMIICTGGVAQRQTRSEADGCQEVLLGQGVPESAIILENTSRSTEENAINVKPILQAHRWQTAILVSDSYHMLRARYLFNQQGIPVVLSPVALSEIESPAIYVYSVFREVLAWHWQTLKELLHLPFTYVPIG